MFLAKKIIRENMRVILLQKNHLYSKKGNTMTTSLKHEWNYRHWLRAIFFIRCILNNKKWTPSMHFERCLNTCLKKKTEFSTQKMQGMRQFHCAKGQ